MTASQATGRRSSVRSDQPITPLASPLLPCYSAGVPVVVTCAQSREEALEADLIRDEKECALRDHLPAVHPKTLQPGALGTFLRHFVVIELPPPAA